MTPVLELRGIHKTFGAATALDGVDFTLEAGEVHALLGENGAGKTTLMRIAYGLVAPTGGEIMVRGAPVTFRNPSDARRAGIGMVHQHFTSIPAFTVAENVALAAGWRGSGREAAARVRQLSETIGFEVDPLLGFGSLSAGRKQRVEVLKAMAADASILLLDEPTSVLAPLDGEELLAQLTRLRARGISTVLITHKLREALAIADRVTVLRQGRLAFSGVIDGQTAASLASHMLGEAAVAAEPRAVRAPSASATPVVQLEGLVVERLEAGGSGLTDATLALAPGELVGLAAVEGNGQRELFRALAGLVAPTRGSLRVKGAVSFVPEDRTSEALIEGFSLTENLVLSQRGGAAWMRGPWIDWTRATTRARELLAEFRVRAEGPGSPAGSLSGGNQQRVVVAEALERSPAVLLAENPTRGLDFKASADILGRLAQAAASGVAVLIHMPDLDEMLPLVSRVIVLSQGRAIEMPPGSSRERIGRVMLGAEPA